MSETPAIPERVELIDWQEWQPLDRGTILFVVRNGEILLIHKKRGLGAGKVNGPGGRLHDGETPLECAVREVDEEIGVLPTGIESAGQLLFQFLDGYSIHVWVYRAEDCVGSPVETDEAIPFWVPVDEIPYDSMWADDAIWLPLLLRQQTFHGRFIFDRDQMLDHQIEMPSSASQPRNRDIGKGCSRE